MRECPVRPRSALRSRGSVAMRAGAVLAMAGLVTGCSFTTANIEHPVLSLFGAGSHTMSGYVGTVVADEPQAALAAQTVLQRGGNAADAAAALGLALSVTLPSRASLGAGGACLAWKPTDRDNGRAFLFLPTGDAPADSASGQVARVDRPASAPMLARGLFLMQLRYGSVDFSELTRPAIQLARGGMEVGTQLASDLAAVQAPLFADEGARRVFGRSDGTALKAGDMLYQPRLAGALERIRSAGPGDLYVGSLAQTLVAATTDIGGGLTMAGLRNALPLTVTPLTVRVRDMQVSFLPPPADGGLGTAIAWKQLDGGHSIDGVGAAAVASWRNGTASGSADTLVERAQALLNAGSTPSGGSLPALPASTSFAVVDRKGEVVACALTMNNLFGTGRVAGSTGIVLGASSAHRPLPLLTAAIAHRGETFVAAATASGQADAADAAALALSRAISGDLTTDRTGTTDGRANAISCVAGKDGNGCAGWVDPRSGGYAARITGN